MMVERILHIWRFPERKCEVQLPDSVLHDMICMAYDGLPDETGGTLVGCYSGDRRIAYVRRALGVKVGARRTRFGFYRPPDQVDTQLADVYRRSRGHLYFIGEWHTHPNASSKPSRRDLDTLMGLAESSSVATDTPILMILGEDFDGDPPAACILATRAGNQLDGLYEKCTVE